MAPSAGLGAAPLYAVVGVDDGNQARLAPLTGEGRLRRAELDRAVVERLAGGRTYLAALAADGSLSRHPLVGQLVFEDSAIVRRLLNGDVVEQAALLAALAPDEPLAARLIAAELVAQPCDVGGSPLREAVALAGIDPLAGEVLLYGAQRCGEGRVAALAVLADPRAGTPVVIAAMRVLELEGEPRDVAGLDRWVDDGRTVVAETAARTTAVLRQRGRRDAGASSP